MKHKRNHAHTSVHWCHMTGLDGVLKNARYRCLCVRPTLSTCRVACLPTLIDGPKHQRHILETHLQKLWSTCIKAVSPPPTIKHPIQPRLAATQILSVVSELECSICLGVLTQPMQLPCDRLVCATCLIKWIHVTAARCPCCYSSARLECKLVNPAPKLIQQLLHDVIVWCESWMSSIKAIDNDSHCCSTVKNRKCNS